MSRGKVVFLKFVNKLMNWFENAFYQYEDTRRIASYFWDLLSVNYKLEWKDHAKCENITKNLSGKKKMRGFWLFAMCLMNALICGNESLFADMWEHMLPEEKNIWETLHEEEVESWIQKQIWCIT